MLADCRDLISDDEDLLIAEHGAVVGIDKAAGANDGALSEGHLGEKQQTECKSDGPHRSPELARLAFIADKDWHILNPEFEHDQRFSFDAGASFR